MVNGERIFDMMFLNETKNPIAGDIYLQKNYMHISSQRYCISGFTDIDGRLV